MAWLESSSRRFRSRKHQSWLRENGKNANQLQISAMPADISMTSTILTCVRQLRPFRLPSSFVHIMTPGHNTAISISNDDAREKRIVWRPGMFAPTSPELVVGVARARRILLSNITEGSDLIKRSIQGFFKTYPEELSSLSSTIIHLPTRISDLSTGFLAYPASNTISPGPSDKIQS